MNLVLVKPESETRSQVVVRGQADPELSSLPWRRRAPLLWPAITAALDSLRDEYELLVLEGAGSPAEINLVDTDLTNARLAAAADAAVILVCDIDRGGAFAHLYGTWALLDEDQRGRIVGFVLNKFRGDPMLPAARSRNARGDDRDGLPRRRPLVRAGLPDEDGAASAAAPGGDAPVVAVVRYPFASNFTSSRR